MVKKGDTSDLMFFLFFALISLIFTCIKIRKDKNKFRSFIESELSIFNLTLIDIKKPTWYDNIPTFPEKITLGNLITNGGANAMNEYYYRKIVFKNSKNESFMVWVEIKENYRFEILLTFNQNLEAFT